MRYTIAFLLFIAVAVAQQSYPEGAQRSSAEDLRGYTNVPTCDAKYEYVGIVYDQNLVAHNQCMPLTTTVSLREWEEMKAQLAELQDRLRDLEAKQTDQDRASNDQKVHPRERK